MNSIKSVVAEIKNEKNLQSFYETKPSAPHVILFTTKDKPTPLYKALSLSFNDKMVFGLIPESASSLVSSFGVSTYPTLMKVTAFSVFPFDGEINGLFI